MKVSELGGMISVEELPGRRQEVRKKEKAVK